MMKKRVILAFLAAILVVGSMLSPGLLAASEIQVTIDGVAVDFDGQGPAIVDGRTLVPVRGVFEALGFDVDWEQATQTAVLTSDEFEVAISIGSSAFTVNGASHTLDVPAQIIEGRTMLPIRAVLESVGLSVDWDGGTSTVLVSSLPLLVYVPTPTPSPQATPTPTPEPTSELINLQQTVWLSRTGVRYHQIDNCGTMNPVHARPMSRQDARNLGHQACANCW